MKSLFISVVAVIVLAGCKKKEDADLTVTIAPEKITLINVQSQSCVDLYSSPIPEPGSLASPHFIVNQLTINWKNRDRDLKIVSMRFVFKSAELSGTFDQTVSPAELKLMATLSGRGCDWCTIHHATDKYPVTTLTFNDSRPFTFPAKGPETGTTGADLVAAVDYPFVCGLRLGGLPIGENVKTNKTFSGFLVVQGLAINKNNSADVTNLYVTAPIKLLYEAPPL